MWYETLEKAQEALKSKSFCLASSSEEEVCDLISNLIKLGCTVRGCTVQECLYAPFIYIDKNLNITMGNDAREFYNYNKKQSSFSYLVRDFGKFRTFVCEKSIDKKILDKESEGKYAYILTVSGARAVIKISRKTNSLFCCSERMDLEHEIPFFEPAPFWYSSSKSDDKKIVKAVILIDEEINKLIEETDSFRR